MNNVNYCYLSIGKYNKKYNNNVFLDKKITSWFNKTLPCDRNPVYQTTHGNRSSGCRVMLKYLMCACFSACW